MVFQNKYLSFDKWGTIQESGVSGHNTKERHGNTVYSASGRILVCRSAVRPRSIQMNVRFLAAANNLPDVALPAAAAWRRPAHVSSLLVSG